jgi:hypothetical protein
MTIMKRQGVEMFLNGNEKNRLLDFITKINRHAWVGMLSSFNMDNIDMESCKNFHLAPELHQKYDAVWLYEKRLDHYHILSWKIIIDEALRLLGENGFLVIRLQENKDFTIPMVKSFLGRNINIKIDIELEYVNESAEYVMIFKIERLNIDKYKDDRWTFAMLTIGKKDENVLKFLESIRSNDKENKHEIIISGPQKDIYNKYNVKYLDMTQFRDEQYAEISKKKNVVAKIASNPNLLIAHDRYYLNKTFFSDFEKYGYDFDFLVIRQLFEDGTEFPSYTFSYEPELTRTHPVLCRNYQYLFRLQYVNGGIMIFKTHNLRTIPFNNLLFWDQMEDVEITQKFINNSLIPRVNFINTAYAVNDKSDRTRCFTLFDIFDGEKIFEKIPNAARSKVYGINTIPKKAFL